MGGVCEQAGSKIQGVQKGHTGHASFLLPNLTIGEKIKFSSSHFSLLREDRIFFPFVNPLFLPGPGTDKARIIGYIEHVSAYLLLEAFLDKPPVCPWVTVPVMSFKAC